MFDYIRGTITEINAKGITVENNRIGFKIKTPNPFLFEPNTETTLWLYLHVRKDVMDLYGFASQTERDFFLRLISVKGLGPKGAMAILAGGDISRVIDAIKNSDNKFLEKFPGIGTKASQQIILDLNGRLLFDRIPKKDENPKIADIKEALKNLGYKPNEIKRAIPILEENINLPIGSLIKTALKYLS